MTPVYCDPMLAELARKLRYGFLLPENHIRAVIYEYRQVGLAVKITQQLSGVASDPDDDKFVECAIVGGAEVIVSKDKHLLQIGPYHGIAVIKPADFLVRYWQR